MRRLTSKSVAGASSHDGRPVPTATPRPTLWSRCLRGRGRPSTSRRTGSAPSSPFSWRTRSNNDGSASPACTSRTGRVRRAPPVRCVGDDGRGVRARSGACGRARARPVVDGSHGGSRVTGRGGRGVRQHGTGARDRFERTRLLSRSGCGIGRSHAAARDRTSSRFVLQGLARRARRRPGVRRRRSRRPPPMTGRFRGRDDNLSPQLPIVYARLLTAEGDEAMGLTDGGTGLGADWPDFPGFGLTKGTER